MNHRKALNAVRKKDKIKVAFLLIHESVWKYEEVYRFLERDDRFDPLIVVCPYIQYGEETLFKELNRAYEAFKIKGYQVIKSFDEKTNSWLDVKKVINPDVVFFTNQWNLTRPEYYIYNYLDTLTCYVPYAFKNSYLYQSHFNGPMQNFVWKFFIETDIHKKLSKQYSDNKSINTLVTGYPGMDIFFREGYQPIDLWKIKDRRVKRIIWAPHHTISGMGATLDFSTFLKYADYMFELAQSFEEKIQIAFKPHPILRAKLTKSEIWGKEKTDKYYKKWEELPNGLLNEGEYHDLFLTSDGMIHDCGSFLIEYLYTNKPVMYLIHDESLPERLNEVGKMALSNLYHGKNYEDIRYFLNNVIINGNDDMKNDRKHFFDSIIKPPNNLSASENIYNYLKSELLN